ncbi:Sodium, potassium, lithium and rubidium/H(+) antiporter [Lentilactobacillus parabuchneri]|uniref:Sodium, potassium, lithium and rubidium/H(+) antiporter n=4 Tax=Lentilactobacillus parabuchneri TaxID=152331 RepID=A0A1X1FCQ4_9LACO|nr:cation:proton antiporter [Lentilactobacillus parabuchneri]APR08217.1 Sodium, potassium, lithium and rubidium/H(+) antiporter [Lentilactobacillus parabuchneri]KRM46733.1 sodium hydrogen exchanger [Lentilactobacillus parabuchneri DSM 5707 = NBRC 107865]KRN74661.1 sodium hydrogen exchanger [Lentilactobacillus parabuchneri]MBW0222475.1 sodium:proton antiporter [Lentilactobacillus parabuchneri]MBW0244660.1 sodium:proton antiporter [Lentilactobacillus parabuchneri]
MHILEAVILLMTLVVFSNVVDHFIPAVPVSLIQVVLGLGAALVMRVTIPLETDWFLLLFIAPLLFNDGRRFPKRELWKLRGPILANAIVLVFLTTILGGFLFHLIIPTMPFSVSFALAAILSPTDPVAVQSISKRAKLPEGILHIVSGESLINDASGLIAFKYAVAATVTGVFSIKSAAIDFIYISIVGFVSGILIIALILMMENWLYRQGINDVIFSTVLQVTTPFVVYLVTEEFFHASGVIAVVAAGIIFHFYGTAPDRSQPELKLVSEKTWDIIIYTLNGIVFLILGIELPLATTNVIQNNKINTFAALGISFVAWLILLAIRVFWIYTYQAVSSLRSRKIKSLKTKQMPTFKAALLAGLSGVRGAVTMAGVLSIPMTIDGGSPFPSRSLALFVAAGVIIISLVVATITLPLISEDKAPLLTRANATDDSDDLNPNSSDTDEDTHYISEDEARVYIMKLAVQRIEEERRPSNQKEAFDLILDYQFLIRRLELKLQDKKEMDSIISDELALRRVALRGERAAVQQLFDDQKISRQAFLIANAKLQRLENQMIRSIGHKIKLGHGTARNFVKLRNRIALWIIRQKTDEDISDELSLIQREEAKAAISALSAYFARDDIDNQRFDSQSVYHLIVHYRNQIELAKDHSQKQIQDQAMNYQNLRIKALAAEREGVQVLLEQGNIDWAMAAHLRQYINYSETVLIMDYQNQ